MSKLIRSPRDGGGRTPGGGSASDRRQSRLRFPRSVEGLVDAMRAFTAGDARPLDAWHREQFPILNDVIHAWTRDADLSDRLACRIMRQAFFALRAGREIRSELSWVAGIAIRGRAEIRARDRPRAGRLPDVVQGPWGDPIDDLIRREDRERVRGAIASLPTKYRLALTLRYLLDRTEPDVATYLEEGFGIRLEGTRSILKRGREMVRTALEGRDPPRVSRYPPRKKAKPGCTSPPLPGELHG